MEAETGPDGERRSASRGLDLASLVLAVLTVAILAATVWTRQSGSGAPIPLSIGATFPPVRLLDFETGEPLIGPALKGKITWLVFCSLDSPSGEAALPRLENAWKHLKLHRSFTMVAATADAGQPDRTRALLGKAHATLPVFHCTAETLRRLGIGETSSPVHFLIDEDGRIAAMARGEGQDTIGRLAKQAASRLHALDPTGETRFAAIPPRSVETAAALR